MELPDLAAIGTLAALTIALAVAIGSVQAVRIGRPNLAVGGLTLLSAFSLLTIEVGTASVRLEQPVVALLAPYLVVRQWHVVLDVLRRAVVPVVAILVYLAANLLAAIFVAPDPLASLRLVAWMALSVTALGVTATLARGTGGSDLGYGRWLVLAGIVHTAVAMVQLVGEVGLGTSWGVLRSDASIGKTFGLAWEPNLLAIHLAATTMFVIEPLAARNLGSRLRAVAILALPLGIGLALSRGGLIALALGIGLVILRTWWPGRTGIRPESSRSAIHVAAVTVGVSLAVFATLSALASAGVGSRPGDVPTGEAPHGTLSIAETPTPSPDGTTPPTGSTGAGSPVLTHAPVPSDSAPPTASPDHLGASDTIALRVRNLVVALRGVGESPLVGHGPGSFGQRYEEPSCSCPAHIPNQLASTVYESGLLGLSGLLVALAWIGVRGWRVGATAHVAALVVLLVGYQVTDALRFGSNWVLLGVIVGLILRAASTAEGSRQPRAIR